MSWFKVDDTAHSHPKIMKATNAALGLWLRAGSYAAQHLTDGAVPGIVAQHYGTAPQIKKLISVGLWHEHGHACPRCPQPPAGDYVIHDYHEYNPTRAAEQNRRQAAADRQKRARDRAAEQRNAKESTPNRPPINDETQPENLQFPWNQIEFPDEIAGQGAPSQRDGVTPSRSPRPDPTRSTPYGSTTPPTPRDRPGPAGPAETLLARWWETYGRQTAQNRSSIGRAIADALANGLDADALWPALARLGDLAKPITGGTLQFALAELRRPTTGAEVIPLDRAARPSTTDQRVAAGLDLAARLRAQEAAQ